MTYRIFYSWQADSPNKTNRGLIRDALDKAVKQIESDEPPIVESDRQGVPGSPDILYTILKKIDNSQVFICDVSIVGASKNGNKPIPNPNVIFELGYAMKSLGMERILMVFNTASGNVDDLPFDLKRFAAITYHITPDEKPADARNALASDLKRAIEGILDNIEDSEFSDQPAPAELAVQAIERGASDADSKTRAYMRWLVDELEELAPESSTVSQHNLEETYTRLKEAIDSTILLVASFAQVAEAIAGHIHKQAALALLEGFKPILEGYQFSRSHPDRVTPNIALDFYRFVGHELFVSLIALLMRERRWQLAADLLKHSMSIDNVKTTGRPGLVSYNYFSEFVETIGEWGRRKPDDRRISLHADILRERHTNSLGVYSVPFDIFADADYFLFLRSEMKKIGHSGRLIWRPWSYLHMGNRIPGFLINAYQQSEAEKLLVPLDIESIESLRHFPIERYQAPLAMYPGAALYIFPLDGFDPTRIGFQ